MFSAQNNLFQHRLITKVLDGIILLFCSLLFFKLRNGSFNLGENYQILITILILVSVNLFSFFGVYKTGSGHRIYYVISKIAISLLAVLLIFAFFAFFTKSGEQFSRLWFGSTILGSFVLMSLFRFIQKTLTKKQYTAGANQTRILIIGAGDLGEIACDTMLDESWAGYKPVGFISDIQDKDFSYRSVPFVGSFNDLEKFIEEQRITDNHIHEVWLALPLQNSDQIQHILTQLKNTAVKTYLVPDLMGLNLTNFVVRESAGIPVFDLNSSPLNQGKALIKRLEDITLASLMLIVLSPLMVIISLLIKVGSKGSIFFKQKRYGLDGKEILVWKFRSMTTSDNGDNVTQATKDDARVTQIGKFIRRFSIDELPQLFNVLNGSMSLIGPRPHAVAHNELYRNQIEGYMSRHIIKPGMTGWAQVNGCRGETETLKKMEKRIRYDLEYIQNWSIILDMRILLKTISEVFKSDTAY